VPSVGQWGGASTVLCSARPLRLPPTLERKSLRRPLTIAENPRYPFERSRVPSHHNARHNPMLTVATPSVATEIPGREHSLPQGEQTKPTLTASAFFVSPPVRARTNGGRCLSTDVSGLSRVPSPSDRHERESLRFRAKSHSSLAPNRGQVNGRFEFGQRIEMPCLDSDSELVLSAGPLADNRSDRLAIATWLRGMQNADVCVRFRRADLRHRSPTVCAAQIMPRGRSGRTAANDWHVTTSAISTRGFRRCPRPPKSPSPLVMMALFR
jgi:hypothetical protein